MSNDRSKPSYGKISSWERVFFVFIFCVVNLHLGIFGPYPGGSYVIVDGVYPSMIFSVCRKCFGAYENL